jgi:LuxR family transcriptional regulator, maltose regulon positive regulatory protein
MGSRTTPRRLERVLIRTKLTRPRAGTGWVRRPRLLQRLDDARDHRVTLISAPPGFGKSTLAAQWLDQQAEPCAWLALDAFDDTLEQFAAYLVAAIEGATPYRLPETAALLAARTPPPFSYL